MVTNPAANFPQTFLCIVCKETMPIKGRKKVKHINYPDKPFWACAACLATKPDTVQITNRGR